MDVRKTRQIDSGEPDAEGFVDYFYEYDVYEFVDGDLCVVARSYTDEPQEAHLLNRQVAGKRFLLDEADLQRPLVRDAIDALRREGKTQVRYLSRTRKAYLLVD